MQETILITKSEIQEFKQISNSINSDKLNQIIKEAQFNDLLPLLGERLYNDLMVNTVNYADLLDGSVYTVNNITYTNYGLKAVLAHYVYARYAMFGDVIDNPFGMTTKLNLNESKQIDYSTKKTFYAANQNTAYNYWLNVESFLIRTKVNLYESCSNASQSRSFRLTKIG